ncbi:hypothetical protein Hdeb2414_s0022g00615721 [Helianthus debilis subsp. tardiflorus]
MLEHVLVLSAYLFSVGVYRSRNMVRALMCLEFILNAGSFSVFVIAIEAVIGLAIVSSICHN